MIQEIIMDFLIYVKIEDFLSACTLICEKQRQSDQGMLSDTCKCFGALYLLFLHKGCALQL